jgi:outer membrane lipoprotein-sorting protein
MRVPGTSSHIRLLLPLVCLLAGSASSAYPQAQQADEAMIVQHIDAVIKARFNAVLGFSVTEHYNVYRNSDETHPAAEMTVKTTYNKDTGKSYAILSETGSEILKRFVLDSLLENEKRINEPGNREASWFTSANYEFKLLPDGIQRIDGRDCYALSMTPRQKASNLIQGTMWVDAKDFSTVKIEGVSTKSPSMLTGASHVMRQYALIDGYAQATHARAESDSALFGKTLVSIDYGDYDMKIRAAQ